MWQCDRVKHHKRSVGVAFQPLDHVLLDQLLGVGFTDPLTVVARQKERFVVVVEISREIRVGVALAVVAKKVVDPLFEWAAARVKKPHAPLPESGGGISCRLRDFRNGDGLRWDRQLSFGCDFPVATDRTMAGVQTGKKRRPTRRTNGCATVGLLIARSLRRHLIQVRSLDEFLPVNPNVPLRDIITENKDEVW